jgi:pilus assembly protein CpaD
MSEEHGMTDASTKAARRVLAALAVSTLALAGCTKTAPLAEPLGHSRMPPDYQDRHPILLSRATQALPIEVGTHAGRISGIQREQVEAVVRSYRAEGEGVLAISVPSGAANETAAVQASRALRGVLAELHVPPAAITVRAYRPEGGIPAPPVTLSYTKLRAAVPHRCAVSTDMDATHVTQWENFGCAAQSNLAAMVANPNDLQGPRPLDRASSQRRYNVLDRYNSGQDTTTTYRNENAGTVSTVAR